MPSGLGRTRSNQARRFHCNIPYLPVTPFNPCSFVYLCIHLTISALFDTIQVTEYKLATIISHPHDPAATTTTTTFRIAPPKNSVAETRHFLAQPSSRAGTGRSLQMYTTVAGDPGNFALHIPALRPMLIAQGSDIGSHRIPSQRGCSSTSKKSRRYQCLNSPCPSHRHKIPPENGC